jgi:phasin family protein
MTASKPTRFPQSATDPMKQMEGAVAAQKENIETVVRAGTSAAARGVEKAVALTKEQMEAATTAGARAFKGYEELLEFGKENVEAVVKASTIVARGLQSLSQSMAGVAQTTIEEQMAAGKAMFAAKSVQEVIELSSSVTKANFEKLMAEGSKITEISTKLAEEAFVPLTHRVTAAVERFFKVAA